MEFQRNRAQRWLGEGLNTRHLETFVTVVEKGSFSKAAQEMVTTPSALTQQVNALERDLGFPLLARDHRGATPTAGGQVFYERAKSILELVREAQVESREAAGLLKSTIRFGSDRNMVLILLKQTLTGFAHMCPDVEVKFVEGGYREMGNLLDDGVIDLYLSPWGSELDRPDLGFQKIGSTRLCCSMAFDHPLASKGVLLPSDLSGCDVIIGCGCPSRAFEGLAARLSAEVEDVRIHRFSTDEEVWSHILTQSYLLMNMDYAARYMGISATVPLEWPGEYDYGFVYRTPCGQAMRRFLDYAASHPEPAH